MIMAKKVYSAPFTRISESPYPFFFSAPLQVCRGVQKKCLLLSISTVSVSVSFKLFPLAQFSKLTCMVVGFVKRTSVVFVLSFKTAVSLSASFNSLISRFGSPLIITWSLPQAKPRSFSGVLILKPSYQRFFVQKCVLRALCGFLPFPFFGLSSSIGLS